MRKVYTLKNGYKLAEIEVYDGHYMTRRWGIFNSDGNLYRSCVSFKEAYKLASNLVVNAN